jgi:predicted RNase H-related nuclease YkuK (DUF458 family)
MNISEDKVFFTSYGLKINLENVVDEVLNFISLKPDFYYKITIGSDSEIFENKEAEFVTAIVVHRLGNGGRFFWKKERAGKFYNLHDRIIQEVLLSIDTAQSFIQIFKSKIKKLNKSIKWGFEIHVDVGENGPTKTLIQEVVGIIKAHNFEPKTKPESYAASNVADIFT